MTETLAWNGFGEFVSILPENLRISVFCENRNGLIRSLHVEFTETYL